jgi:hypothetical protein
MRESELRLSPLVSLPSRNCARMTLMLFRSTSALAIPAVRSREGDVVTHDSRKEHGHDPQDSSDTLNQEQIFSPMSTAEQLRTSLAWLSTRR